MMSDRLEMRQMRDTFLIKQNQLVTKDNPYAISFLKKETETTFYTTELIQESVSTNRDNLVEMKFYIGDQITFYERTVYNILDLLGDIGGLYDALYGIFMVLLFLMSFVFRSGASNFIIKRMFKQQLEIREREFTSQEDKQLAEVKAREPMVVRVC